MSFLRLIRLPNLFLIILTQYLIRYTIVIPILTAFGQASEVSETNFFLVVLSTVLIAAGGYIINDYYDLQIDRINKPEKVIIGNRVSKKQSINMYAATSLAGIAIGAYLSFFQDIFLLWQINFLSASLLLLYSSLFKKIILVGNFIISLLAALSVYLLLILEKKTWVNFLLGRPETIPAIAYLISAYALFAFLTTWIREIIKDLEDEEGDRVFGRKTLPVVAGNKVSKLCSSFLLLVVLFSLVLIQFRQKQWEDMISFIYVVVFVELPLLILLFLLFNAKRKSDYTASSLLAKGIMLAGILSMFVFYLRYK